MSVQADILLFLMRTYKIPWLTYDVKLFMTLVGVNRWQNWFGRNGGGNMPNFSFVVDLPRVSAGYAGSTCGERATRDSAYIMGVLMLLLVIIR